MENQKRNLWLTAAGMALLLIVCIFYNYLPGPGGLYPRDAAELDLREKALTAEDFETLQAKLPECDIRWSVPIGGKGYDSRSTTVYIEEFSPEDIPLFAYFPALRQVNGSRSQSYEALLALYEAQPDLDVRWGVEVGGQRLSQGCEFLRLSAEELSPGELGEALRWLPEANKVVVSGVMPREEQAVLAETYPDILFDWEIPLCGLTFRSTATTISFAGESLTEADLQEIADSLVCFPALEVIDLDGCGLDNDRLKAFREETGVEISWNFELCGVTVNTLATEIDLSNRRIPDVTVVEDALPYFSRLEKVVMCNCRVPYDEMDALNNRYEDIRFVWSVQFAYYNVRTDAVEFIATKQRPYTIMFDYDTGPLKYLTDLQGLDLGHMEFKDISFLYHMPHLKYLILADGPIKDITPIASLKELTYLELFQCPIEDITPLKECTALEDLNICYIWARRDNSLPVLKEMTWLDRLWYCGSSLTDAQLVELQEALPNCEMSLGRHDESTGGTWREHENYYEMRDFFGMYYMKGGTNGVDENGNQKY